MASIQQKLFNSQYKVGNNQPPPEYLVSSIVRALDFFCRLTGHCSSYPWNSDSMRLRKTAAEDVCDISFGDPGTVPDEIAASKLAAATAQIPGDMPILKIDGP